MARQKEFRPLFGSEGFVEITETITLGTAMQTLSNRGVSFVTYDTSGQPNDAVIPDPDFIGRPSTYCWTTRRPQRKRTSTWVRQHGSSGARRSTPLP